MTFGDEMSVTWVADIYLDGYGGGTTNINGSSSFPMSIDMDSFDDPFEPVCMTTATLDILDTAGDTFTEFRSATEYQYYVDIKRAGSTWWKGFYITETFEEQYTTEPYGISLTFGDGMNELAFERYDNAGTLRSAHATNIDILVNCFNELPSVMARPFREMINVFEDAMNDADTEGLLEQLYIYEPAFWEDDDGTMRGISCLEVIRGLMFSLGCRIIVSQEIYYMKRVKELEATAAIKYVDYDSAGLVTANSTLDLRQPISARGAALPTLLRPTGNDAAISYHRVFQEIRYSYTSRNITTINNNVVINWNFDKDFELQNGSQVPLHFTRSAAVNTSIGVTATGLHLAQVFIPQEIDTTGEGTDSTNANVLVMGDTLLANTKITSNPGPSYNDATLLAPLDATRETYTLTPTSPADNSVSVKNLLHGTSDHLEITIKGWFDYTYTSVGGATAMMFNKWTIKLGANYYNMMDQTWDTTATNRVHDREWGSYDNDEWIVPGAGGTRRHYFDKIIRLEDFPSAATSDLVVTWFIPETMRGPNILNSSEEISAVEIVFEHMQIRYISADSTEFSVQKALGDTGSTSLRTSRDEVVVKHGDGPSNFSVMSHRIPTKLATSSWSTRGGAEALPSWKHLIVTPRLENLSVQRSVWSGSLRGFMELHNTISNLEGKIWLIKGYSFNVRAGIHNVVLHEVGANTPVVSYIDLTGISLITQPSVADDTEQQATNTGIINSTQSGQGYVSLNSQTIGIGFTAPITNPNDTTENGGNYPL